MTQQDRLRVKSGKSPCRKPRRSGVDDMFLRRTISPAEMEAIQRFGALCEAAEGNGLAALDYGRQRVDGGGERQGRLPQGLQARAQVESIRLTIGHRYFNALRAAVDGGDLSDVAAAIGKKSRTTGSTALKGAVSALLEWWRPRL